MNKINNEYIYIMAGQRIGEMKMNYVFNNDINIPYSLAFQVITKDLGKGDFEQTLKPGQLHQKSIFYQAPISIFYVQVLKIERNKKNDSHAGHSMYGTFKADLRLFNKSFTKSKEVLINVKNYGNPVVDFTYLNPIINFLNKYIDNRTEFDKLDVDKLIQHRTQYSRQFELDRLITDIKIEFYSDPRNIVGKDQIFYTDVIFKYTGGNQYFLKLIFAFLKEEYKNCTINNSDLIAYTSSGFASWPPSNSREKFEDLNIETKIRFKLAIWIGQHFNYEDYSFSEYEFRDLNI